MKNKVLALSVIAALGVAAPAFAEPAANPILPSKQSTKSTSVMGSTAQVLPTSVKDVLSSSADEQRVAIEGKLLRQVGEDKFLFTDGTGEIVVEIDTDDHPSFIFSENLEVKISGEVDHEGKTAEGKPAYIEIDVDVVAAK